VNPEAEKIILKDMNKGIHVLKHVGKLEDKAYRDILKKQTSLDSTKEMTTEQLLKVRKALFKHVYYGDTPLNINTITSYYLTGIDILQEVRQAASGDTSSPLYILYKEWLQFLQVYTTEKGKDF